jgi:ankyrin repeat protein
MEIRDRIMISHRQRAEQKYVSMCQAAGEGDVEQVLSLVRHGVDIDKPNHDGRTILHMAADKGNYAMVEALLQHRAHRDAVDRWGSTPLFLAMQGKHTTVIGLLTASNATLSLKNPSAELCTAASAGDLTQVRRLVDNRVDPNSGDYDKRTALHLAASEGHDKVVEYLLSSKADPSPIDRWGSTPLNDALKNVHELVAKLLQTKGATIKNDASSLAMLCEASARGNVKRMRLMHDYGQRTDKGDYDFRYPLHLAAAEGRILAVSFLLGISSDPTCADRWGNTPMDDAFRGGTLYHIYCAKLIQGWGGELSANTAASPEGEKFMKQLDNMSIKHVRMLIKRLIEKQYDKIDPIYMSDEDVKVAFGATMKQIPFVTELQVQCKRFAEEINESGVQIAGRCLRV